MHMHKRFMVKVISLSDEAYRALSALKGERSFSQLIMSLIGQKAKSNRDSVLQLFGRDDLIDVKAVEKLEKDWKKWAEKYV